MVRTDLKADGGAERKVSYDIFPAPPDILWPNGIGFSALPANPEMGTRPARHAGRQAGGDR